MGLPLCYEIVSAYGGEIAVESKIGKGSSFTVTLPNY
ncbi:MAG: ATP-binding protein [Candidatus Sedimenticola sp. 20ELBAFRAG]